MASADDALSAQKNAVAALSNLYTLQRRNLGTNTSACVTADTLIVSGKGRLVNYAVLVAGSADGGVYDSATVAAAAASNQLCATDKSKVGVYPCGQEFTSGLVIKPGAGQTINVTYSPG